MFCTKSQHVANHIFEFLTNHQVFLLIKYKANIILYCLWNFPYAKHKVREKTICANVSWSEAFEICFCFMLKGPSN